LKNYATAIRVRRCGKELGGNKDVPGLRKKTEKGGEKFSETSQNTWFFISAEGKKKANPRSRGYLKFASEKPGWRSGRGREGGKKTHEKKPRAGSPQNRGVRSKG